MTKQIIRQGQIQPDTYDMQLETDSFRFPCGDVIVSLAVWQANQDALKGHQGKLGLFVDSDQEVEELADLLPQFDLVAINFPGFTDGRGFSIARLLRERCGYQGDIRAVGDVMQDQLFYLTRCGFTSFALKEGKNIEQALTSLKPFSESYQAGVDQPQPLFRRRQ